MIPGTGQQQAMLCQWCESTHHTVEDCQAMKESTTPQEQTTSPPGTSGLSEATISAQTGAIPVAAAVSLPTHAGSCCSITAATFPAASCSPCRPTGQRNTQAVLQDIQTQLGSVAQAVAQRAPGTLPGQTIPHPQNPNEHCNAIMTRSGKMFVDPPARAQEREAPALASPAAEEETEKEVEVPAPKPQPVVKEYIPQLPFPTRLHKDRLDAEFGNFMAMLRKLNVQVPFLEALSQMPKYAKFLKDLLSKK
ncbi:unnamed protein product [Linum trigynum]|uniref:Uncharacterized protein n=1 Tax=Linum trigynum TaxID=586398 RepID=A0AAV2FBW6_9ROSI